MIRRLAIALTLAAVTGGAFGGCGTSCPAALAEGTLLETGPVELSLRFDDGRLTHIQWPFGYGVRLEVDRLVVTDAFGSVIAREGDSVGLGGGSTPRDERWIVCGLIEVRNQNPVSPG